MSARKIRKLGEMIEEAKGEIKALDRRLREAERLCDGGKISRAEFTKAKMEYSEKLRGLHGRIVRYEKARLNLEREAKDKKEDEEEERKKRQELRSERRREREKEKRRKLRAGEEPEEKPAKKGFFSFFRR